MDTPTPPSSRNHGLSNLIKGQAAVASAGLAAASLIFCAIAAGGWWTLHSAEQSRRAGREQTLRAAAEFLAPAGERMIASGDLSQLRTLIAGASAQHHFHSVRLALPEPRSLVIADSAPAQGSRYAALPETWSDCKPGSSEPIIEHTRDGRARIVTSLNIPGKGPVSLEVEDGIAASMWSDWRTQAGVGAIGIAAILAMTLFYRSVRSRFRSLGAISESLTALQAGEIDSGVLLVSRDFGPEAEAWNSLLAERDDMRVKLARTGAEQKLGDRRNRDGDLFSLCDAMWQGLLLIDDQLNIKYINGAGAAFLRGKREDMLSKPATSIFTDVKVVEALKQTASGTGRGRAVLEVENDKDSPTTPGAPRQNTVLRYSIRPVRKEDNAAAVVVIEDITQQRVADEARHTFVASATHELRTPLTNMRLYIDSLLEEPDQDIVKRTQAVNVVSQEAKRLERMVGDMLSVAQIESGTIKLNKGDVRLEPVFEDLKQDFAEQARQKDIKLRFDMPPKWPQMEGDRDKIVMALHNLVGNAIKYTPAGGEVIVRANADAKSFSCDVTDNGIGIKDEEQPLVFEKFYRAKDKRIESVTGTGLGLAIAREVVRLHGGDISLKSAIDKGSTFTMTLPAKAA